MSQQGDEDDQRSMNADGTQENAEAPTAGGRTSRGPAYSVGGEQEPGGVVPPYEGRKESADVHEDPGDARRDGATVGGATEPTVSSGMKAPDPSDTPGGRTTSPADEQPAAETASTGPDEGSVGPAHVPGTPRGEDRGA